MALPSWLLQELLLQTHLGDKTQHLQMVGAHFLPLTEENEALVKELSHSPSLVGREAEAQPLRPAVLTQCGVNHSQWTAQLLSEQH